MTSPRKKKLYKLFRNIMWFNPPHSENIQMNVARSFLYLIDKHFPKVHILHTLFNRNNVKVSHSCTSNMANIIKRHYAKILRDNNNEPDKCNYRKKDLCPLDGTCLASGIVYRADVTTTSSDKKIYIGKTEHTFKT